MTLAESRHALSCPNCGTAAPTGARFCPECGNSLVGSTLQFQVSPDEAAAPSSPRARPAPSGPLLPLIVFAVGLVLMIVFGVLGLWWTEVVIVPVTLVMAFLGLESAWARFSEPLEALARRSGERLWASGRVGRVALVSWTRAAGTYLSVCARRLPAQRRHRQALHLLGGAVYRGDDHLAKVYRSMAESTGDRLQALRRELHKAQRAAESEVEQERVATDSTAVFTTRHRHAEGAQSEATADRADMAAGRDDMTTMTGDRR